MVLKIQCLSVEKVQYLVADTHVSQFFVFNLGKWNLQLKCIHIHLYACLQKYAAVQCLLFLNLIQSCILLTRYTTCLACFLFLKHVWMRATSSYAYTTFHQLTIYKDVTGELSNCHSLSWLLSYLFLGSVFYHISTTPNLNVWY